ncbi:MAG: hypothetical protein HQ504_05390 [Rhodospirillaceae bacterium]|nr:hypothetical protein [Rhodospirillaceae bacterium]
MDAIVQTLSDNKVAWMLALFFGVAYWAFRPRWRRLNKTGEKPEPPKDT